MQKHPDHALVTPSAPIATTTHGWRAKCLQRLIRLDLPVPCTVALSFASVRSIAAGHASTPKAILAPFGAAPLVSIRPSPENPDWGGPGTILNIGLNTERHAALAATHGQDAADALYLRFVQSYAIHVARLDPDMFDAAAPSAEALRAALRAYEVETEEPFPQDPAVQLTQSLRSMARAWEGTTARLLRQAKGAPQEAGLGLIVQEMALGMGQGVSGSGVIQFVDAVTGNPQITGRYLSQSLGRDAL
ncbi:MAG: pyruvate, phosphate dikinase, partial [Gemmobacter sp.]|nr:pyruvate, phosphate dikinase [Gemmobacter sp.]